MILLDDKHTLENLEKFENRIEQILGLRKFISPTFYIYHINIELEEFVVSAPNEKDAFKLVGYTDKNNKYNIQKIGKDTTGTVVPYIVMG